MPSLQTALPPELANNVIRVSIGKVLISSLFISKNLIILLAIF